MMPNRHVEHGREGDRSGSNIPLPLPDLSDRPVSMLK